jgi:hypothetical protein
MVVVVAVVVAVGVIAIAGHGVRDGYRLHVGQLCFELATVDQRTEGVRHAVVVAVRVIAIAGHGVRHGYRLHVGQFFLEFATVDQLTKGVRQRGYMTKVVLTMSSS